MSIDGRTLIEWGLVPGRHFGTALAAANRALAAGEDPKAAALAHAPAPYIPLQDPAPLHINIRAENEIEARNVSMAQAAMDALMRVPTVRAGAIMPDACPAGTIPVGGVIETENAIHPGFHSADICCSMAISVIGAVNPKTALDAGFASTYFGYGGRKDTVPMPTDVADRFGENPFLKPLATVAARDFASQGDGNHFLFVGRLASSGETAIVTHHGSRGPGAALYKAGMKVAEGYRRALSPETPAGAAWIPADTNDGRAYWSALLAIRDWTYASHMAIHNLTIALLGAELRDRWWNEHNFIFERDKRFFHAKGATPAWAAYERTLVPLSMGDPVLVTRGTDAPHGLGFLPHGAGRNMSRTKYLKSGADLFPPIGIDCRFYSGAPDPSEYPGAYKPAATIESQMREFGLADVIDKVEPYGSIMAGEMPKFWLKNPGSSNGRIPDFESGDAGSTPAPGTRV